MMLRLKRPAGRARGQGQACVPPRWRSRRRSRSVALEGSGRPDRRGCRAPGGRDVQDLDHGEGAQRRREAGYRYDAVMGGETAFGGNEVVAVMSRLAGTKASRFGYRLLATSKTSTMQKELQAASDAGFQYRGQTVFTSAFGGEEVVCILERDGSAAKERVDYRLVAMSKTGTLQKELAQAGAAGYQIVGMTVGKTALGGNELVAITRRVSAQ